MTNRESSSPAAPTNKGRITALNPNDVLMGRGRGPSQYIGNRLFLELVDTRKDEYTSTESYIAKRAIAQQVYHEVKLRGGRFLKLVVSDRKPAKNVIDEGVWCDAGESAGLERCKQALRAKRRIPEASTSRRKTPGVEIEVNELLGRIAQDDDEACLPLPSVALHVAEQQEASSGGTKVSSVPCVEYPAEALLSRSASSESVLSLSAAAFRMPEQREESSGGSRASSACGHEDVAEALMARLSSDEAFLSLSPEVFNMPEQQKESSSGTKASSTCDDKDATEALMARRRSDENEMHSVPHNDSSGKSNSTACLTYPGRNMAVIGEERRRQGTLKGHRKRGSHGKGGKRCKRDTSEGKGHLSSLTTIACAKSARAGSYSQFEGRIPVAASPFQTFG